MLVDGLQRKMARKQLILEANRPDEPSSSDNASIVPTRTSQKMQISYNESRIQYMIAKYLILMRIQYNSEE